MVRTKGADRKKKHKKILKEAKGYWGARSRLYRYAKQSVMKSREHAYDGRKRKKRDFRQLWITRISAACKQRDFSYSRFIHGLSEQNIELNRKYLSDIAVRDPEGFDKLVELAKEAV